MSKLPLLLALASLAVSAPATATGGFNCETAGPRPIQVMLGVGHVPGAPIILSRLVDNGRNVKVSAAQWWFDSGEFKLFLIAQDAVREELVLRAVRKGAFYDGSVWRNGRKRWVRCREA